MAALTSAKSTYFSTVFFDTHSLFLKLGCSKKANETPHELIVPVVTNL